MENPRSLPENDRSNYHLQSLNHTLDILEVLSGSNGPLSLNEIAKTTSLVKSGAFRILHNLELRGYVTKNADGRYTLGIAVWQLGCTVPSIANLQEWVLPILRTITSATNETTHLAVLDRMYSVYIQKTETSASIRAYAEIGDRAPAHAVATGKVLLSCLAPDEQEELLARPLEHYTSTTITDPIECRAKLDHIRANGYALNDGEWRGDVVGIAVPARIHPGLTVALGIAGPRYRFSIGVATSYLPLLRTQAHEIEKFLTP